jgi:hypothetical protein
MHAGKVESRRDKWHYKLITFKYNSSADVAILAQNPFTGIALTVSRKVSSFIHFYPHITNPNRGQSLQSKADFGSSLFFLRSVDLNLY